MATDHPVAGACTLNPTNRKPLRLTFTFIGCGDAFGSGGRDHTCFHLTDGARNVLLDCGASALPALKRAGVDCSTVDLVVISHLHGDHFAGVPFLLLDGLYAAPRTRPLTVAGPPGVEARVMTTFEAMFPGVPARLAQAFSCRFVEYVVDGPTDLDFISLETRTVVHPSGAPSCAVRVCWHDTVVAYSGDTAWTDALIGIARDADLFVCECCSYDSLIPHHLNYRTLLEKRTVLGAKRVVLTHLGPDMLTRSFGGDVELAEPGAVYRF